MEGALTWTRGESIPSEIRSGLKVVGKMTPDQAFRRLRGVLTLLRQAELRGLVVLLDEAESMMRLASPQRLAAYNAIREIIDTCESEFPGCLFIFAGTQKWFEDEFNGVAQYRALYERIRNTQKDSVRDLRQPIIRLEELEAESLTALAKQVREIHGSAYGWDAGSRFTDKELREFIARVSTRFGNVRQKPRGFLKSLVDVLDAREQGLSEPDTAALEAAFIAVEHADANLDDVIIAGA
jgi:hypothetical protein